MATKTKSTGLSVPKKTLLDSLTLCDSFAGKSPHFKNLRFTAGKDLTLSACSGEGWVQRKIAAFSETEMDVALDSEKIARIVRGVAGADVEFALDDTAVKISSGGAKYRVPIAGHVNDIPDMPEFHSDSVLTITCAALARIVSLTASHASIERHDGNRQGMFIRGDGESLSFFATNTHRLSAVSLKSDFQISTSVPMAQLRSIVKSLQSADESEVSIRFEGGRIQFEWPETKVTLQCFVGDAPNWERIIPESVATWSFDRQELVQAVDRMMLIEPDFKKVMLEPTGLGCTLSSQSVSAGTATELVPCTVDGECEPIRVNGGYLRDALMACEGEVAKLHLAGPMKAIMVTGDAEDWRGLIVPVAP